jgi:Arc/MetJ-type ribon-helix-helix transcriptional regulator
MAKALRRTPMKRVHVNLPEPILAAIRTQAKRRYLTVSGFVRDLVLRELGGDARPS